MIAAKTVSLTVRPSQVALLCFETGGILGESFVELGSKVSAFDFSSLYKGFRAARAIPSDVGRLQFDSDAIEAFTRHFALGALRAEPAKAALNKAINARENAFFAKHENEQKLISFARAVGKEKLDRLRLLSRHSQNTNDQLDNIYHIDGRTGVVKTATSVIAGTITSSGKTESTGTGQSVTEKSSSEASGVENQTTSNTDYAYRIPELENLARNERTQIGIMDESMSHMMQTHNLGRLEQVFRNERASIDCDVNQLQNYYLNTILLSPLEGIVTGVYKGLGDSVSLGEPVFRVEDNSNVLFVAEIACPGRVSIGARLKIKTDLFDLPGSVVEIEAEIVSARGQSGEDDQWEVIAKRSNLDPEGKTIFPLGYNFDYDNTKVTVLEADEI